MRPESGWNMSAGGLTAQDLPLPPEAALLQAHCCQTTAGATPCWGQQPELDSSYFSLEPMSLEHSLRSHQQVPASASERQLSHPHPPHSPGAQRLPPKKPRPSQLTLSSSHDPSTPSPPGDDQVVPSFQRLSVYERTPPHTPPRTPSRSGRPRPPLPGFAELVPERGVEDEADFFSGAEESRRLVPELCPKPPALRPSIPARRSFRGCGQVNYAYLESLGGARVPAQSQEERGEQQEQRREERTAPPPRERAPCRLRRSHSGPALRPPRPHPAQDKPQVPPRVPIPPRTPRPTDPPRRWSAEVSSGGHGGVDRPPRVPPRERLASHPCSPNPKSLPTYLNGVMPPTQSFAPDPNYVSRPPQRQQSEGSPCILPIMEQGRKASTTHYFLLPQRPAYLDRLERFLRGAECASDWDRRPQADLV
ncbi:ERBB receptor feedback inhibitor 1a [Megalops cyprinoides]|uniref:ERBB receptor feedback inhibitor 1a n=1 Tax=Megalops cyprinoides TaxID=118141 RepID=UPI0018649FD8|nr:ERBB receptor feedback inhibitor 1a [Megalops cyprinoides]XP_036387509.1 ERBB receptor feedback inhibitor 1a [Megalops cyprinoides]